MKRSVAMVLSWALAATGVACFTELTPLATRNDHRTSPTMSIGTHSTANAAFPSPTPGVDLHSATAVAIAEVEATWSVNTTVDAGWYAGELAASAYMTPNYAASIRYHPPTGAPGTIWDVWAAHHVTTTVSASIEADSGGPIDTAFTAYRKVVATVTPHGGVPLTGDASLNGDAAPNDALIQDGAAPWVGQAEVWVTYLVVSRSSLAAPWQVVTTETKQ
jgi:hypothetical protein